MTEPPTDTATESATPPPEPGAPGPSPSSIDDQLADLRVELSEARDLQTESSSDVAKFTAQIAALEALKKDLAKTQADYEAAHHELESQLQALMDYQQFENDSLADELEAGVADVDAAVKSAWSKLTEARATVERAEQQREVAEKKRDQRDEERAEALASMTAIKDLVGTIRSRIKQLEARKKQIDAAHADDHFGVAYWLLTQARFEPELDEKSPSFDPKLHEDPTLLEPDELPAALEEAVTAHNRAEADFADAEAELTKESERLNTAEVALKSLEKTFLDDLAAELKLVKPVPEKTDHPIGEADHG